MLHIAHRVWAQGDDRMHCLELATWQLLLKTYPNFETSVNLRFSKEEYLPVEYLMFCLST